MSEQLIASVVGLWYRRVLFETAGVVIADALWEVLVHVQVLEKAADGIEVLIGKGDATILAGHLVSAAVFFKSELGRGFSKFVSVRTAASAAKPAHCCSK